MTHKEWLEKRGHGLGGSEIAAVLGLSPWAGPLDIWALKTGKLDPEPPNAAMQLGTKMEPHIAEAYGQMASLELEPHQKLTHHPKYPIFLGTPDYRVKGKSIGVEIKWVGHRQAWKWGEGIDDAPIEYVMQAQWYMMVTGWSQWNLAALIGGSDLKAYELFPNGDLHAIMTEEALAFWQNHVLKDVPPSPEGSKRAKEFLAKQFPAEKDRKSFVDIDYENGGPVVELIKRFAFAKTQLKSAETSFETAKNELKGIIGEDAGLRWPTGKISWLKNKDEEYLDADTLIEELKPSEELIKKHTKTRPGPRVFRDRIQGLGDEDDG